MPAPAFKLRRITCIGFDWRAEVSLKETLTLLRGKTSEPWLYTDEPTADVVVYEINSALAQAMVRRHASNDAGRVFIPSASDDSSALTLRYPFGASRLIACLDGASTQLQTLSPLAQHPHESSLCQQLDDALRAPGVAAIALRAGNQHGLLRLPERELRWSQSLGVEEIAALLSGDVGIQTLTAADDRVLRQLEAELQHSAKAESLLWAIGIARSKGTLLHRLDIARPCRLRRWPDFGSIGRRNLDIRCASLLTQRELTPAQLATMAGIPLAVIGNFLNACALTGLLELGTSAAVDIGTPAAATPTESGLGSVLRRIRLALTING